MSTFERLVRKHFAFLMNSFNAEVAQVEKSSAGEFVTFRNDTTAVRVSLEPRDGGVLVYLVRLRDGEIPAYPIFLRKETAVDWLDLETLVSARDPSVQLRGGLAEPSFQPPEEELRRILVSMARALKKHCPDILHGDFTLFDELEPSVRREAEEVESAWLQGTLHKMQPPSGRQKKNKKRAGD